MLTSIAGGGIGARDFEQVGEFGEEELVVGAFGGGGGLPAGDEGRESGHSLFL